MLTAGYAFPAGTFQVQKWTAALFIENPRGYCINELGTGKTRSILFAFDALKTSRAGAAYDRAMPAHRHASDVVSRNSAVLPAP